MLLGALDRRFVLRKVSRNKTRKWLCRHDAYAQLNWSRKSAQEIMEDVAALLSTTGDAPLMIPFWNLPVLQGRETHNESIVGGSSTLHLIGRDEFFGLEKPEKKAALRRIVNNIFFHIEKIGGRYPVRNMGVKVLRMFRGRIVADWQEKYGDCVIGFESLVELPRTGEVYKRDGWTNVGITVGYTCKRVSGKGKHRTDSWTGQRVWDTKNLRPKRVFVRRA